MLTAFLVCRDSKASRKRGLFPSEVGSGWQVLEVSAVEEFAVGDDLHEKERDAQDHQNEVEGGHAADVAISDEGGKARLVLEGCCLENEE